MDKHRWTLLVLFSPVLLFVHETAYGQDPGDERAAVAYVSPHAAAAEHGVSDAPFTSLQQALNAGATDLYLAPGLYDEGTLAIPGGGPVVLHSRSDPAGAVDIRGTLTLDAGTSVVLAGDGVTFRITGDLLLPNGTLTLQGGALEINAPTGTTGTMFVGAGSAVRSAQCDGDPLRYTGGGTINVVLETTADSLRHVLPCIEVAMEETGRVTFDASGLPATTPPSMPPDRLDVLATPRFTILSAADSTGVYLRDGLDLLEIADAYRQLDGGLLMSGTASTEPEASQPTVQTIRTGDAFLQEAGTFYAWGGHVDVGGPFYLGRNEGTAPSNALFSLFPQGTHTVQGPFRVALDANPNDRADGAFDPQARNRYILGGGQLVAYGDYHFDGTGDAFDDDAYLEQDQGLNGTVIFAGATPQRVYHRQDEDAFFEDVTLMGEGGLRLLTNGWQNYDGVLSLRQGHIVPTEELFRWVIINPGFEPDLGERNNAAPGRGVVELGSDGSFVQGEVIRIIERQTLGVRSTGGYLFPVGAACSSPFRCAPGPTFRPLILEFPADLGATPTARVKYRPDLIPEDLEFPEEGFLVDDFRGGTLTLDVLGNQFWQLEFDQLPAVHPNIRIGAAGLPNVNDIESLRLMQWDCDGRNPRLAAALEYPFPGYPFVSNVFIDGVPNLTHEGVNVQPCQIIGIASNVLINPLDMEVGDPVIRVQLINGAIETETVDVYIDDVRVLDDFDHLTATPFMPLPAGTHKTDVVAGDDADNAAPLWTGEQVFFANVNYALILVDTEAGLEVVVQDDVRLEAESDDVEFFVVNAVPDAPPLDIRLLNDPDRPELLVNNIASGEASSYRRLPPADYLFQITNADNSVEYNYHRFDLPDLGGQTFIMLVTGRAASTQRLRLLGFEPDGNILAPPIVDVEDAAAVPVTFALQGNYPNPFNPSTTIAFDLPERADVHVEMFDVLGRVVLTTPPQPVASGAGRILAVDASTLASGPYLYRVVARTATRTFIARGRMILAR